MKNLFGKSTAALTKDFGNIVINEYQLVNPTLARVTVTCASFSDKDQLLDKLAAALEGQAAPIQSSFRWLEEKRHAIGYVALARKTRVVVDVAQLESAGFKEVAKNVFLEGDENVWELKEGAAGKYLVRNSEGDDLSGLLEEARVSPMGSTPRMSRVQAATAKVHEFVAFVNTDALVPFLDYGFSVGQTEGQEYRVVSSTTGQEVKVNPVAVAGVYNLKGEQFDAFAKAGVKLVKAQAFDAGPVIEYYRKAYSFAPDYIAKIVQQVEHLAAM